METKSPQEVAALLGVDEVTIRRLRHKAGLPERKRGQGYTQDEIVLLRAQQRYKVRRAEPEEADPIADTASELHASNAPLLPEMPASPPQLTAKYEQLLRPSWEISRTFETNPDALSALADIARQNDRIIAQNDRIEQRLLDLSATLQALEDRLSSRPSPSREATPAPLQSHTGALSSAAAFDPADLADTMKRPAVKIAPASTAGGLPPGLESWRWYAERHGISDSTVKGGRDRGDLPVISGKWKIGNHYITGALDAAGQHKFWELWGQFPQARRCTVPGCLCQELLKK